MKRALAFLKATLLGSVIALVPACLAVFLVLKALAYLDFRQTGQFSFAANAEFQPGDHDGRDVTRH